MIACCAGIHRHFGERPHPDPGHRGLTAHDHNIALSLEHGHRHEELEQEVLPEADGVYVARCAALPAMLLAYAGGAGPLLPGPQNENRRLGPMPEAAMSTQSGGGVIRALDIAG